MKRIKKDIWPMAAVLLAGAALLFVAEIVGLFNGIDSFLYDLNFRLRGAQTRSSDIVIAAIDEKTLARLGKWPLSRDYYARLLAKTTSARAVGFDIIWSEPSPDDGVLAEAVAQHGRVVLPAYIGPEVTPVMPLEIFKPFRIGHVHVDQDVDGKVRQVYHSIYLNGHMYPSFASAVYEAATGRTMQRSVLPVRESEVNPNALYQFDPMMINYYGPLGSFQKISFYELIEGNYKPSFFKDKVILAGLTAEAMQSRFLTPFTDKRGGMSSIELHANILNNLLLGNSIKPLPETARVILALIFIVVMFALFMSLNEMRSAMVLMLALATIFFSAYFVFSYADIWMKSMLFYAAAVLMFGISYLFKLNRAAAMLDLEYSDIASHLRFGSKYLPDVEEKGLIGFLSAGGINSKVAMADSLARQLLFEKTLTDAVISNSMSAILLFEQSGHLVMANEKAKKIEQSVKLDMADLNSFIGSIASRIMGDSSSIKALKNLARHGETVEFTLCTPAEVYLKTDAVMISFENDRYILFVMTDVTEIKRLEMMKNEMVSLISHELRTPLTAIQGYGNILEMSVEGSTLQYIKIINREADRMNRLISTYLDLARLESGERLINRTNINMSVLVDEVISLVRPLAEQKNIALKLEMSSGMPDVTLDGDLVRQGILNLLENAVKYSSGNSEIKMNVDRINGELKISVADQGVGMDSATAEKIFDKFYRANVDNAKDIAGHGLGLTFVKYAVELQGGSIDVQSEPGKGSVFTVTFPMRG